MKKLILIFGMALFVVAGCQEKQDKDAVQVVMYKQHFEDGTETPINGERNYYKSGDLHEKVTFVDGYPETVIYYFPSGQEKIKAVVTDSGKGKIYHTYWYESGQKKFESTKNTVKEWHKNGQPKSETHYDENGDLHGIAKMWDKEGALKGQERYEHGEMVDNS